jgi:hypothetical protein
LNKVQKLLAAGFEKRGLKELNKLIAKNNDLPILSVKNNNIIYSYDGYKEAMYFQKNINNKRKITYNTLKHFFNYIKYAIWFGYEDLIPGAIKEIKSREKSKEIKSNIEKYNQTIAIARAAFLMKIGKNEEAYEELFEVNPLTKMKPNIEILLKCKSPLSSDLQKFSVAAGIELDKSIKPENCSKKLDKNNFYFDIKGNKVTKKNKHITKEPSKKKSNKMINEIKLLD